jgi:energy-converting hydrogenase Eha subunit E
LIIYVPGIGRDRSSALLKLISDEAGRETRVVKYPHRVRPWSVRRTPERAAGNLQAFVAAEVLNTGASDVVLIGHSLGGLILRSAWLKARGYDSAAASDWAGKVSRIVLLGSPNGGYRFEGWSWLRVLYAVATPWADFAIEHAKSGGYWVTNLRLRWFEAFRQLSREDRPEVVDVVGMDDRLVTPDDVRDTVRLTGSRRIEIADTSHAQLIDVSWASGRQWRWPMLRRAIFDPLHESPASLAVDPQPVAFIFHGIRASADDEWIAELRRKLEASGTRVIAPDTGFFSAFEFALPFVRNRKAHDFLEQYGDAALTHDPDNFRFFGHSNGTYMMGRAMERVPAVRFRHILLAGTVLAPRYDWGNLLRRKQIGHYESGDWSPGVVHNERGRIDVPVGILAGFLNGLWPWNKGVGPGGVVGFPNAPAVVQQDNGFFVGGHAGALGGSDPQRRDQIVEFLNSGAYVRHELPRKDSSRFFLTISRMMRLIAWPAVFALSAVYARAVVNVARSRGKREATIALAPLLAVYALLRSV